MRTSLIFKNNRAPLIAAVVLCGCRDVPDYPVPEQSPAFEDFKSHTPHVVDMSHPGTSSLYVRDILDSEQPWRWTLQRPAVKVKVATARDLNYVIDFALSPVTMKDTGPVTIAFTVNDQVLDRVRYDSPGQKHFEKPVPPDWIEAHKDTIAGAEIDKVWVSKDDGARLGFLLMRIGLIER
jgi:hypothetical protein